MIRLLGSLLLLSLVAVAARAEAEATASVEIAGVRVGIAGRYKPGLWTPVEVTLQGGSRPVAGRVSLTVPDGDGMPSRVFAPSGQPQQVPAGEQVKVSLFARFGRVRSELAVEFRTADRLHARRSFAAGDSPDFPPAILSGQELILAIGPKTPGGQHLLGTAVEAAIALLGQKAEEKAVVAPLTDCEQMPTQWYGYEGIDLVVLSTSDPEVYSSLGPSDPRITALDEWLRMGGRLVLCVGNEAETVLKPGAPLARFSPGKLEKMVWLRQAAALETYSGSRVPISTAAGGRIELHVPLLADIEGSIDAGDPNWPLVVRRAYGFGQIVFVAFDLDRPPFSAWEGRGRLVGRLLGLPASASEQFDETTAVMHYGFTDMAGQLRSALDHFPGIRLAPFSLVAVLIVLYVLAIGPGDYFFLRKVVRRMQLTWITFPAVVLAAGLGAYCLAGWLKGNQLRVNQVDLVDVDTESGRLRGTAWANVLSPGMQRYNLAFEPTFPGEEGARRARVLTAWLGLPGDALGGMNPKATDATLWKGHYDFSQNLDALLGVPIQVWATKSLTARWTAHSDTYPEANLRQEDRLPNGTITNTLDFALLDCLLVYGKWVYKLGTLEPGQAVRVGPVVRRSELKTLLTGRKMVFHKEDDKLRQQTTPYDQGSLDVPHILRTMAFFNAAGGRRYTGLSNRYQAFVDFSRLLETNRAVLYALAPSDSPQAPHHGAQLVRDGRPVAGPNDQHVTIYRFVYPVAVLDSG